MNLIREPLSQKDIIYFIVTDRFCRKENSADCINPNSASPTVYHGGNFAGIIEQIPYLNHLGITALWITPVYLGIGGTSFNGERHDNYHGYWPMDFEKIDPHLTGRDSQNIDKAALKNLADELHKNEIKLILDMVVNHTGYHTPDYLRYAGKKPPEQWFSRKELWDLFGLPDLNHNLADVRDYFCNNILEWIEETGIDGIRMDTVAHVEKEFWYYFKAYVRGKYRQVFFLGEALHFDEESVAAYQREHDFDSMFDFPLRGNIIDVLIRNEDFKPDADRHGMQCLARMRLNEAEPCGVLDRDRKYNNANRLVTLLDNHDLEKRIMSWALEYSDNNLAQAVHKVKYVLGFLFTTRGIPQIYYGTELGLEGSNSDQGDSDLRRDMPWSLLDPVTNEPKQKNNEIRDLFLYTKALIRLRKENEALSFGYLFTLYSDYYVYCYLREFRGNTIIVAMNNGYEEMPQPISVDIAGNTNVPSRVKDKLAYHKVLVNVFDASDKITFKKGFIDIKIAGKTTAVYRLY